MPICDFSPGTKFTYNDVKFRSVKQVDDENVIAEETLTLERKTLNRFDLLQGMEKGIFKFDDVKDNQGTKRELPLDVGFLTEKELKEAQKNHDLIAPLLAMEEFSRGRKKLAKKIAKKAKCHWSHLYWLVDRFNEFKMMGLISWDKLKGPKERYKLLPEVKEIIDKVIADLCPDKSQPSSMRVYREIVYQCQKYLPKPLNPPSYCIVNEIVKERIEQYTEAREGKEEYNKKYGVFPGHLKVKRALQCVQADHKKLDIKLLDPVCKKVIGQPWLTVIHDIYSHAPVGFHLGFEHPNSLSVSLALRNAIWIKNEFDEKYKTTEKWKMYGIPELIIVDNALEFKADMLKATCAEMSIAIQFRRKYTPWYAGCIERFNGTLDTMLINELPGRTFSKYSFRKHCNPEKEASLTLDQLKELIYKFIVDYYIQRYHGAIFSPPAAKWKEGLKDRKPRVVSDLDTLKILLMKPCIRKIENDGIHFANIVYWNDRIRNFKNADEVQFKVNPENLSCIYIKDPETNSYFPAFTDSEFAKYSLWEIKQLRKFLKKRGKELEPEGLENNFIDMKKHYIEQAAKNKKERQFLERIANKNKDSLDVSTIREEAERLLKQQDNDKDKYLDPTSLGKYKTESDYYINQ